MAKVVSGNNINNNSIGGIKNATFKKRIWK